MVELRYIIMLKYSGEEDEEFEGEFEDGLDHFLEGVPHIEPQPSEVEVSYTLLRGPVSDD